MHPQLVPIAAEYRSATERVHRLRDTVALHRWRERRDPMRWSVAECVAHLNVTSRTYVPILLAAVAEGERRGGRSASHRYRRDPIGWVLWKTMGPPVRMRMTTPAAFVPEANGDPAAIITEFEELERKHLGILAQADGMPLNEIGVQSPFEERMKYNLYSGFSVIPRHQHRHLWQAEQVWPHP